MFVLTVDSSRNDMEILTQCIKKELPDAVICGVPFAKEAYKLASNRKVDLALIDMELGGEDSTQGMELAERLTDLSEDTVIMFTSSEEKHAVDAYRVHAGGFILKPLTEEKVEDELAHYKKTTLKRKEVKHDLRIRCFGNFEIFIDGVPAKFKYQKTKEMLAYLVDRKGSMVSNGELISCLWEGVEASKRVSYLKNLKSDLTSVFESAGYGSSLIKQRGLIGINPNGINCDYFDLLNDNENVLGLYWGEYMNQYSWSEITHAYLETLFYDKTRNVQQRVGVSDN